MKPLLCFCAGLAFIASGLARADTKASKKVQELLKDLKSPNPNIRIYAADELGYQAEIRLANAKVAIPALIYRAGWNIYHAINADPRSHRATRRWPEPWRCAWRP
jgi:hypothetical protein